MKRKFLSKILYLILIQALAITNVYALDGKVISHQNHSTLSPILSIDSASLQTSFLRPGDLNILSARKSSLAFQPRFKTDEQARRRMIRKTVHDLAVALKKLSNETNPIFIEKVEDKFWGTILDTSKYSADVPVIKIFGYLPHKSKFRIYHLPELSLQVKVENGHKKITELTQTLFSLLNGNEIEMDYSRVITDKAHADEFWNKWKTDYADSKYCYSICTEHLYVQMIRVIRQIIAQHGTKPQTIVDIFGGDGEFMIELFVDLEQRFPGIDVRYHLIERNAIAIEEAKAKLGNIKKTSIWPKDLTANSNIEKITHEKPTIVTAIGGLVKRVVTFKDAYYIATNVYKALPEGGYFILTGYKESHLNAQIFESIGFEVLNKTLMTKNDNGEFIPYSLYILQKKSSYKYPKLNKKPQFTQEQLIAVLGITRRGINLSLNNFTSQAI